MSVSQTTTRNSFRPPAAEVGPDAAAQGRNQRVAAAPAANNSDDRYSRYDLALRNAEQQMYDVNGMESVNEATLRRLARQNAEANGLSGGEFDEIRRGENPFGTITSPIAYLDEMAEDVGGSMLVGWGTDVLGAANPQMRDDIENWFQNDDIGKIVGGGLGMAEDIGLAFIPGVGPALLAGKGLISASDDIYEGAMGYDTLTGDDLDSQERWNRLGAGALNVGLSAIPGAAGLRRGGQAARGLMQASAGAGGEAGAAAGRAVGNPIQRARGLWNGLSGGEAGIGGYGRGMGQMGANIRGGKALAKEMGGGRGGNSVKDIVTAAREGSEIPVRQGLSTFDDATRASMQQEAARRFMEPRPGLGGIYNTMRNYNAVQQPFTQLAQPLVRGWDSELNAGVGVDYPWEDMYDMYGIPQQVQRDQSNLQKPPREPRVGQQGKIRNPNTKTGAAR